MRYRHCPRILDDVGTRPPLQRGVVALGAAEAKFRQQLGIPDVWMRGECLQLMWVNAAGQSEAFAALDLVDDVAYLQGRPQLQAHVLHHHVAVQQKQCSAVNLLRRGSNLFAGCPSRSGNPEVTFSSRAVDEMTAKKMQFWKLTCLPQGLPS